MKCDYEHCTWLEIFPPPSHTPAPSHVWNVIRYGWNSACVRYMVLLSYVNRTNGVSWPSVTVEVCCVSGVGCIAAWSAVQLSQIQTPHFIISKQHYPLGRIPVFPIKHLAGLFLFAIWTGICLTCLLIFLVAWVGGGVSVLFEHTCVCCSLLCWYYSRFK